MSPIHYLRAITMTSDSGGSNGSVALAACSPVELQAIDELQTLGLVHTIAGLAIVTVEGWASLA